MSEERDRAYEIQTADRLLAAINSGEDNEEATMKYRQLVQTLTKRQQEHGGTHKGTLTLTFTLKIDPKGIDVEADVKMTEPKKPKQKDRLFVGAGGDILTGKDPARDSMFPGDDLGRKRAMGG